MKDIYIISESTFMSQYFLIGEFYRRSFVFSLNGAPTARYAKCKLVLRRDSRVIPRIMYERRPRAFRSHRTRRKARGGGIAFSAALPWHIVDDG